MAPAAGQIDLLVVTASEAAQAACFERELAGRASVARAAAAWEVVPDPEGGRVGSGGATLLALERIVDRLGGIEGRRVLLLHCGGESRRLPMYAPTGKVFVPLPVGDGRTTLFDLVLEDMLAFAWPGPGAVVVGAGDVYFGLAADGLAMRDAGITGVGVPASVEIAAGHGVYVLGGGGEVVRFLQKPSRAALEGAGALDERGLALADSGVVSLPPEVVAAWLAETGGLRASLRRGEARLDLYADQLTSIGGADGWPAPGGFHALAARSATFIHLGSTRALFEAFVRDEGTRGRLGVVDRCASRVGSVRGSGRLVSVGSRIAAGCEVGDPGTYVEACRFGGGVRLGGENVVVGVSVDGDLELDRGMCLAFLPLEDGRVAAAAFGIDDDFKSARGAGGTIAGRPLGALEGQLGCAAWPDGGVEDLWHARVWRLGDGQEGVADALALARGERVDGSAPRASMSEIVRRVDHARLAALREDARVAIG